MLFYQIPKELKPKLPAIENLSKTDSNMGISTDWVKIVVHIYQSNDKFNLPRVIWARKDWTLKELHMQVFKYFLDLLVRWFKDFKENNDSNKSSQKPVYRKPGSKQVLDYDSLVAMIEQDDLETQFKTFFPNLNENNWKKLLDDRSTRFNHNETPYHLRIENIHGYGTYQPCEWCG